MTPTQLLNRLEREGVKLSIRSGQLFAPKKITQEQREMIQATKPALLAVITHQCPECNQPLKTIKAYDGISWLQCSTDSAHYGERLGVLESMLCPGEECGETIELADGVGWCRNHKMAIRITEKK